MVTRRAGRKRGKGTLVELAFGCGKLRSSCEKLRSSCKKCAPAFLQNSPGRSEKRTLRKSAQWNQQVNQRRCRAQICVAMGPPADLQLGLRSQRRLAPLYMAPKKQSNVFFKNESYMCFQPKSEPNAKIIWSPSEKIGSQTAKPASWHRFMVMQCLHVSSVD